MKRLFGLMIMAAVFMAGCVAYVPSSGPVPPAPPPPPQEPYDQGYYGNQSGVDFYGYLDPFGLWVSFSPYGYVWVPRNMGYSWRPYLRGHWIWTDDGWTWASMEQWGWLVYHYGRWGWEPRLGWYWVPGNVWGPAWVAWRWGDLYIGWAPLPPGANFIPGRGLGRRNFEIPGHYWNFVRGRDFMDRSLDRWILPPERNLTIINRTTLEVNIRVQNNRVVDEGIGIDRVRRMTNQVVERHALKEARQPGETRVEGRDVVIYKPQIRERPGEKPRQALDREQAEKRLATPPSGQAAPRTLRQPEQNLQQRQDREKRLLEQTQQAEINEARRKAQAEERMARSPEAKRQVQQNSKSRIAELQNKHQAEKAELAKRQKEEESKTKKKEAEKKPPVRKK